MGRVSVSELRDREYWTPGQAARVLGRSNAYWAGVFDRGGVVGYQEGRTRHIKADSARDYLDAMCTRDEPDPDVLRRDAYKAELKAMREAERAKARARTPIF